MTAHLAVLQDKLSEVIARPLAITRAYAVSVAAGVALLFANSAWAVPFSQMTSANVGYFYDDGGGFQSPPFSVNQDLNGGLVSNTASAPANGAGTVTTSASADLGAGTLRAQTTVTSTGAAGTQIFGNSFARMGDGFRATTPGGPFSWTPGDTARFTFDITGSVTGRVDIGGSFLSLILFQPGTANTVASQSSGLISSNTWTFGPQNQTIANTNIVGSFSTFPQSIVFDFNPGGDFDWMLVLASTGGLPGDNGPGTLDADFAHTVLVNYAGPQGATTTSVSGLFNNIAPPVAAVPEPGSLGLILLGLLAGICSRKRRHS
jgi:hypothetical protein